jgi:hypothetical protein
VWGAHMTEWARVWNVLELRQVYFKLCPDNAIWSYQDGGSRKGPVRTSKITVLHKVGTINLEMSVWTDVVPEAATVAGFDEAASSRHVFISGLPPAITSAEVAAFCEKRAGPIRMHGRAAMLKVNTTHTMMNTSKLARTIKLPPQIMRGEKTADALVCFDRASDQKKALATLDGATMDRSQAIVRVQQVAFDSDLTAADDTSSSMDESPLAPSSPELSLHKGG